MRERAIHNVMDIHWMAIWDEDFKFKRVALNHLFASPLFQVASQSQIDVTILTVVYLKHNRVFNLIFHEKASNVSWRKNTMQCSVLILLNRQHLYASFGTFCFQIGQLFQAQWVFEESLKSDKEYLTTHCASKDELIQTQKVPKEA